MIKSHFLTFTFVLHLNRFIILSIIWEQTNHLVKRFLLNLFWHFEALCTQVVVHLFLSPGPDFIPLFEHEFRDKCEKFYLECSAYYRITQLGIHILCIVDLVVAQLVKQSDKLSFPCFVREHQFPTGNRVTYEAKPFIHIFVYIRSVGCDRECLHLFLKFQLNLNFILIKWVFYSKHVEHVQHP